jgi:mannonate dehydratase
MKNLSRRRWMQTNLSMAAAGAVVTAQGAAPAQAAPNYPGHLQLALMLPTSKPERRVIAKQIGVNHAIISANSVLNKIQPSQYESALRKLQAEYNEVGITIAGVESHPVNANKIKLGVEGRDEEINNYCAALEALGKVGIRMCCYNFMAGLGWMRTNVELPERGGAKTSEFHYPEAEKQGLTQWGTISQEKMWDNMEYFLKRVIPVAERAGVNMALHPDDPPITPLRGIGRILVNADAFRRVMSIVPSPVNGVTYCQANFVAMGENVYEVAREFCQAGKVFFVHFRDIEGKGKRFHETFHDNGPTDMAEMLRIYAESGFRGPIRPDHAPTLADEKNDTPGYAMNGKILAIGYMKGMLEAAGIDHS